MIKYFLYLVIVCSLLAKGYAQNYKVSYRFEVSKTLKKVKENTSPEKKASSVIIPAIPYLKNFKPILWISGEESLYSIEEFMDNDANGSLPYDLAKILTGADDKPIYQNAKTQHSLKVIETSGETFNVELPFKDFNWTITDETKTIKGFICRKATCQLNRSEGSEPVDIVVWFAPKLPFSFGPLGYGGLPGLILEFSQGDIYNITFKKIEELQKKHPIKKPKGHFISHKEYLRQFEELQNSSEFDETMNNYKN